MKKNTSADRFKTVQNHFVSPNVWAKLMGKSTTTHTEQTDGCRGIDEDGLAVYGKTEPHKGVAITQPTVTIELASENYAQLRRLIDRSIAMMEHQGSHENNLDAATLRGLRMVLDMKAK